MMKLFIIVALILNALLFPISKALVIYVSKFDDPTITPLKYAKNDALAFAKTLEVFEIVPKGNVTVLANPTLGWMKAKITEFFSKAKKGDVIYFYYSGHGYHDPKTGKTYFIPRDTVADYLSETAYPVDDHLKKLVEKTPAEVFMFIDACYSGSIGRDKPLRVTHFSKKSLPPEKAAMILSSGPNETSKEDDKLKHGIFTYYLIKGLEGKADLNGDGFVSFEELGKFVREEVSKTTGKVQNPQVISPKMLEFKRVSLDFPKLEERAFEMVKSSNLPNYIKSAVGKVIAQNPFNDNDDERHIRLYVWKLALGKIDLRDFKRLVDSRAKKVSSNFEMVKSTGISVSSVLLSQPFSLGIGAAYDTMGGNIGYIARVEYSYLYFEYLGFSRSMENLGVFLRFPLIKNLLSAKLSLGLSSSYKFGFSGKLSLEILGFLSLNVEDISMIDEGYIENFKYYGGIPSFLIVSAEAFFTI